MEETFVKVVLFSDKGQEWKAPRVLNYEVNVEILGKFTEKNSRNIYFSEL